MELYNYWIHDQLYSVQMYLLALRDAKNHGGLTVDRHNKKWTNGGQLVFWAIIYSDNELITPSDY